MDEVAQVANRKTRIGLILDKSGSMLKVAGATIAGFNKEIEKLRESGEDITVTFTVFDKNVDIRYIDLPLKVVENLTDETYQPAGDTALYDAIGETIAQMQELPRDPDEDIAYLVKIFSDGQERCSKKFSAAQIHDKINHLQEENDWTFSYVGSNQNLYEVARALSIPASNMASYSGAGIKAYDGTEMAFACSADATKRYLDGRKRGIKKTKNFASSDFEKVANYEI